MRRQSLVFVLLLLLSLLLPDGQSFELQDTIHSLIEENIHLHDQLENLTQALRDLKRMLWHETNDEDHHEHHEHHNEDSHHMWDEWSKHSISPDTHLLLEQVFCGHELHGSASPSLYEETAFLLLTLPCLALLLTSCV